MSNRRKLRRYLADGVTPNPYRGMGRASPVSPGGPSAAPVWRESARPLRLPAGFTPSAFLPGRRGQR
jgi:hypothetical protein